MVSLQELDSVSKRSNGDNVLGEIALLTNYQYVYAPAISFDGGKYGIGILYKEKPLTSYHVPLPGTEEQRTLQVVEFSSFILFNSHLSLTESDRNKSGNIINEHRNKFDKPVFLTGDLNAEPSSDFIRSLKKSWTQFSSDDYTFPSTDPDVQIDYIFADNKHASSFKIISREVVADPIASDHRPVIVTLRKK